MTRVLLAGLMLATTLAAQPFINYRGVVNAASYASQGLPSGGIARGSIFTIFGTNIGPAQPASPASFPLANDLGGATIQVTQGNTTLAAIPIFVSASQISAIMPSTTPLGKVTIRVRFGNRTSNPATVQVVDSAFGAFTLNSGGFGPGIVQNFVSATNLPINTTSVSAKPGQTLILWGTGLGAVSYSDNVAPTAGDVTTQVEIFVGGKLATRHYSGRSPCCSGLDQIAFDVPNDAPQGCYVPVQVRTNHAVVSNASTIAITADGKTCVDSFNPLGERLRKGGRVGVILPQRYDVTIDLTSITDAVIDDRMDAALQTVSGGDTWFNPATSLPPVGTCTFYGGRAATSLTGLLGLLSPRDTFLDGGTPLQVSGVAGQASLPRRDADTRIYGSRLGQQPAPTGTLPLFFRFPGIFNFLIPGGVDVKNAQTSFDTVDSLRWANRDSVKTVDRSKPLTLTWTGGDQTREVALIAMQATHDPSNTAGMAVCVASVSAGSFTVPTEILANLPSTPASAVRIPAWVFVGSLLLRNPSQFSAPGLDSGFVVPSFMTGKAVTIQ